MKKVKTKKELAKLYNVHYNTFLKWIKNIPELSNFSKRRILTPKELDIIYEEFGDPEN